jgi:glycosyltransferase involved in cell wall biosynthesis
VDAWTKTFAQRPRLGRLVRKATGLPTAFSPGPDDAVACFASDYLRRRAHDHAPIRIDRTAVVPHGIDPAAFTFDAHDRAWRGRLLSVGRVEERKGTHVAIEALTHLGDETTLDVVGPPDERYLDTLRRTVAERGLQDRVRFVGPVDRDRLPARFHEADAFLFPVLWEEPFGLVPLEAMASGTPVIATGTGGSAEFLSDGENCLIVERGDAAALARAIERLAGDEALRRGLIAQGRATAERLSVERLAASLDEWNRAAVARFRD